MLYNKLKRSLFAKKALRDPHGYFTSSPVVGANQPQVQSDAVSPSQTMPSSNPVTPAQESGEVNQPKTVLPEPPASSYSATSASGIKSQLKVSGLVSIASKAATSFDQPVMSVNINNPLQKILHWFDRIWRRQTTSFDLRLGIPLLPFLGAIATISFILTAAIFGTGFSLNQLVKLRQLSLIAPTSSVTVAAKPSPVLKPTSFVGTISPTYRIDHVPVTPEVSAAVTETLVFSSQPARYVLISKNEQVVTLILPSGFNYADYVNRRILVTGNFDQEKNRLAVHELSDLEVLP